MEVQGFKTTRCKGFHITFENGITVSVQFGGGNYCANHDDPISIRDSSQDSLRCPDAEIALWKRDGKWITKEFRPGINDDVLGWQSPRDILDALIWAEAQKEE